jgi:outer membrane lipoprotein LolB
MLLDWDMRGRISVTSEHDGWHASLFWQQKNDHYQLKIIGPLGQGTVELNGSEYRVSLRSTREPQPVVAASPERLLRRVMGWEVPVTGMRFWVRGLAVPDQRYRISVDSQGRPVRLKQSGWTILYSRYRKVQGVFLPVKITMQNDRLKVKLIISRWS